MHSRLFQAGAAAVLATVILAIGYWATRSAPPPPSVPAEKLTIAIPMVPHAALLHIAAAKGYFAEEGLDVTLMSTPYGKTAIELVVQGKADVGAASDVVFVLSAAKAGGLGIAANMFNSSTDLGVVARRDRGISAPRDLVGKKAGVTLGAAGEYFLWAFLIRHKLPPGSVTLVDMPPGEIAQQIAAGTVDAISTWQPNVPDAQLALGDNAVTFFEPLAYTETFNVIGRIDFLKGHSRAIEKLVRAILKAEQFIRGQPEEALILVAEHLKVDVRSLRPTWKDLNFRVELRQSQLNALEEEARWAMAQGYLEKGSIRNFLPNLHLDALLAVQPERVTVMR
jgi:ABC-type nitrate/sulfonate/bicarbonate transport system substrate-binding protein